MVNSDVAVGIQANRTKMTIFCGKVCYLKTGEAKRAEKKKYGLYDLN